MFSEVRNGILLGLNALPLVVFVKNVDREPGRDGSGVDIDVVDEQRSAEGKNLDDDQVL